VMVAGLAIASPLPVPRIEDAVAGARSMTVAQVFQMLRDGLSAVGEENEAMLSQLLASEQELRDTLQVIASATAEGE
jgi:hypothetical protein